MLTSNRNLGIRGDYGNVVILDNCIQGCHSVWQGNGWNEAVMTCNTKRTTQAQKYGRYTSLLITWIRNMHRSLGWPGNNSSIVYVQLSWTLRYAISWSSWKLHIVICLPLIRYTLALVCTTSYSGRTQHEPANEWKHDAVCVKDRVT